MILETLVSLNGGTGKATRRCLRTLRSRRRAFRLRPGDSSLGGLLRLAPEVPRQKRGARGLGSM